jgi:hypothetical protein
VPDAATFENNMLSTYNVFQAARRAGIKKIVYASSETVLGLPFDVDPPYIPVDEEYPARPESTYSLVKHLEEQMAIQMTRWDPELSITGLRFSNVMDPEDYEEFPSFESGRRPAQVEPLGVHRRAGRCAGGGTRAGIPGAGVRGLHHRQRGHRDEPLQCQPGGGGVPDGCKVTKELGEHETLLSIDKAKRLLGYAPEHSWRNYHSNRTTPTED